MTRLHPDFSHPGKQPQGPVEIDWSNPLTRGLKHVYLAPHGGGFLVKGQAGITQKTPDFQDTQYGRARYFHRGGSGDQSIELDTPAITGSPQITIAAGVVFKDFNGDLSGNTNVGNLLYTQRVVSGDDSPSFYAARSPLVWASNSTSNRIWFGRDSGSGGGVAYGAGSATVLSTNRYYNVVGTRGGVYNPLSRGYAVYIDGLDDSTAYAAFGADTPNFGGTGRIGSGALNADGGQKELYYLYIWEGRALQPDEVARLDADPYQIFRPAIETPLIVPAGGTSIAANLATRTRTTHAATISRAYNITANLATRTRTTHAATITGTRGVVGVGDYGGAYARKRAEIRALVRQENARIAEEEARKEAERLEAEAKQLRSRERKLKKASEKAQRAALRAEREFKAAQAAEARKTAEIAAQRAAEIRAREDEDAIAILLMV